MIRATEVTKRYGDTLALDRFSLEVPAGSVFGLIGPNGAGKTTFLRLIMGFAFPEAGQIDRGGLPVARIGYLPERAFYPPRFTIRAFLTTLGRLAGLKSDLLRTAVAQVLGQFGLAGVADRRLGACSRGMLQRVGVAQALVGDPPLLLLDEPVLGLDPAAQKFMREQIVALHQAGKTVLLSSHHLDEMTRICTHVAMMNHGHLVRSGLLETMLAPRPMVTIATGPLPVDLRSKLSALGTDISVRDGEVVLSDEAISHKAEALRLLLDAGVNIRELRERHVTLEEVYLEATGG
jgi:ABC-2 type transport system ATP-binding protein